MQISPNMKITISDHVLSQEVRGETVLLDLSSEQYFGLDPVGTRLWQLLSEGQSPCEAIANMLDEYVIDANSLEQDISLLLERLSQAGLIRIANH